MFYLYQANETPGGRVFKRIEQVSLAGSKRGIIVKFLRLTFPDSGDELRGWHLNVTAAIGTLQLPGNTLVIDVKPSSQKAHLQEILNIWGWSEEEWTPILLELRALKEDRPGSEVRKDEFVVEQYEQKPLVYTFLHLDGSRLGPETKQKWTFPRPSSTNSALLWPHVLDYFMGNVGYGRK